MKSVFFVTIIALLIPSLVSADVIWEMPYANTHAVAELDGNPDMEYVFNPYPAYDLELYKFGESAPFHIIHHNTYDLRKLVSYGDYDGDGLPEALLEYRNGACFGLIVYNVDSSSFGEDFICEDVSGGQANIYFIWQSDIDEDMFPELCIAEDNLTVGPAWSRVYDLSGVVSAISDDIPDQMRSIQLHTSPNPFNPSTTINYTVTKPGPVTLSIFDIRGRLVDTIFDQEHHDVGTFITEYRPQTASGVYFVQLIAGEEITTTKMVLVK